jgi:molecular chaperone DnaK
MVDEAEKYGAQDKERKAAIEAANRADSVLNDTEKALKEFEDKLDKAEADQIKEKISTLREFVAKNQAGEGTATAEELKQKIDELQSASLTLFDKMHRARQEETQQSSQGDAGASSNTESSNAEPSKTEGGEGEKKP